MNSDAILRELNRLVNDQRIGRTARHVIAQTIQHIKLQDEEAEKLRGDITDVTIPENES